MTMHLPSAPPEAHLSRAFLEKWTPIVGITRAVQMFNELMEGGRPKELFEPMPDPPSGGSQQRPRRNRRS